MRSPNFSLSSTFGLKTTFIFWKTAHLTLPCEISAFCTTFASWPLKSCHYCTDRQKSLKLREMFPNFEFVNLGNSQMCRRHIKSKNHLRSNFPRNFQFPAKNFHGVGIGPLSKILAVNLKSTLLNGSDWIWSFIEISLDSC